MKVDRLLVGTKKSFPKKRKILIKSFLEASRNK